VRPLLASIGADTITYAASRDGTVARSRKSPYHAPLSVMRLVFATDEPSRTGSSTTTVSEL
jgi:hypothetical protein